MEQEGVEPSCFCYGVTARCPSITGDCSKKCGGGAVIRSLSEDNMFALLIGPHLDAESRESCKALNLLNPQFWAGRLV